MAQSLDRGDHIKKITIFFAGGRRETTHGFAKILFLLWDKSTYLDLEICRTKFRKNFIIYIPRSNVKNYFWGITQSTEFCLVDISQFLSRFRTNIARAHINHVIFVLLRCVQSDGDIISHYFDVNLKNKEIVLF